MEDPGDRLDKCIGKLKELVKKRLGYDCSTCRMLYCVVESDLSIVCKEFTSLDENTIGYIVLIVGNGVEASDMKDMEKAEVAFIVGVNRNGVLESAPKRASLDKLPRLLISRLGDNKFYDLCEEAYSLCKQEGLFVKPIILPRYPTGLDVR